MKNNGRKLKNIYEPEAALIKAVVPLTGDVNLYTLSTNVEMSSKPGQFFMVSVLGYGEVPISVTSAEGEPLKLCVRNVGHVTGAIHSLKPGDSIGIRGPYGNGFPLDIAKDKDIILIAGGLGIAPLRPLIHEFMNNKTDYGNVSLIFGSKKPGDIIYRDECRAWEEKGIKVTLTVDCKDDEWRGCSGVVTAHLGKVNADFQNTVSYICGPEAMINASMDALSGLGLPDERIITTLEAHMKCGVGKCGHCYLGPKYICTDGPVFSRKELKAIAHPFQREHSPDADPIWGY